MKRDEAISAIRRQAEAIKAFGATAMYLFGSTARDEAGSESDLDLFVDYDSKSLFSLVELVGIKQLLEDNLGGVVYVTTRDSLDPGLRGTIEESAVRVFYAAYGTASLHYEVTPNCRS